MQQKYNLRENHIMRTLLLTIVMAVVALFQVNRAQAAACAPPEIDMCADAPAGQADHCNALASYLADFQQEVCSVPVVDADYTPNYAGVIGYANGNIGPGLLTLGSLDRAIQELDHLVALGTNVARLDIVYPLLTPNFHTHFANKNNNYTATADDYLAFYRGVVEAARARGMQVHIEHSTLLPSHSSLNPRTYFDEIKALGDEAMRARYREERAAEARLLLTELAPDYLTILTEPDTDNASFGKHNGKYIHTPAQWADYVQYALSQFPDHTAKIGAGAGTWDSDDYITLLAPMSGLDYIDFHVYPAQTAYRNYLSDILRWSDMVRSIDPTKSITIGEAWLYKATGEELVSGLLSQSEVLGRDVYGYWEPLDVTFIQLLDQAARAKQIEVISPFWTRHFFAYLDYAQTHDDPPAVRMYNAAVTGFEQMNAGALTETGRAYREITMAAAPLIIGSLEPDHGPESGPAQIVTLRGANFALDIAPEVRFGDAFASAVEVIDSSTLRLVVPAGSGSVTVTVSSGDGSDDDRIAIKPNAYRYDAPPTLNSLNPTQGPDTGGTLVGFEGDNFSMGDTPAQVFFGDLPATDVKVYGRQITARTPAGIELGSVDVTIVNADGQRATLPGAYRFLSQPQVHALSTTTGPSAGGTQVTISGKHFMPNTPGTRVLFGGGEATEVTVVDATTIQAVTPAGMGTITVTVVNPDFQVGQLVQAFAYDYPPIVVDNFPREGKAAGGNNVWITGARFSPNAQVFFGDKPAAIQSITNNVIKVTAPAGSGSVTIKVVNPDGQSGQTPQSYVYTGTPAPAVLYFTPNQIAPSGGTLVYIYGQNFGAGATVHFGAARAKSAYVLNSEWIIATAPTGAGDVTIRVTNMDGKTAMSLQPFIYVTEDGVSGTAPDDPLGIGETIQLPVSKMYLPTLVR